VQFFASLYSYCSCVFACTVKEKTRKTTQNRVLFSMQTACILTDIAYTSKLNVLHNWEPLLTLSMAYKSKYDILQILVYKFFAVFWSSKYISVVCVLPRFWMSNTLKPTENAWMHYARWTLVGEVTRNLHFHESGNRFLFFHSAHTSNSPVIFVIDVMMVVAT
jgi:hypothetical protein